MKRLSIRCIGPVKEVDIDLNRINVFIGPQSSGKSTVAKLISFCNWLEKDCVLHQDTSHINRQFIEEKLIKYYNLEGYFKASWHFRYESDVLSMEFSSDILTVNKREGFSKAELSKNAYIPSERNMLGVTGIFSVKMPNDYLLEFIDDWQEIRPKYTKDEYLKLLNLGGSYYFNEKDNRDMILLDDGEPISFSQASSGLQSVTPLCVYIDYLTQWIYKHEENRSAEDRMHYRKMMIRRLLSEYNISDKDSREVIEKLLENFSQFTRPAGSNLVVEEPEQNLFPETQVKLVYYILSKLAHKENRDTMVLTTHSPYILYAMNNCMLAFLSGEDNADVVQEFSTVPKEAWINPEIVSVWELGDGKIRENKTIQDNKGLIRGNYFDRVMRNVMADFQNLTNFIK